ncbi:MAG: hypothetical protein AAB513_01475 [Patescibacteria group bacterium]
METVTFEEPGVICNSSGQKVLLDERVTIFTKTVSNGKGDVKVATIYRPGSREVLFSGSGLNFMDAIYRCIRKKVDSKKEISFPEWERCAHIRVIK